MGEFDDIVADLQVILDKLDQIEERAAAVHVLQAIEILSNRQDRLRSDNDG